MASLPRRYLPAGESAVTVEFAQTLDPRAEAAVLALDAALAAAPIEGIIETVPTYRSLMVHFDPRVWRLGTLIEALENVETSHLHANTSKKWYIPVCYDPPYNEDLAEAAGQLDLSPERVAGLHAGAAYKLVMYGFAPGFAFIAGLPPELFISRRLNPRLPAPPGALTIANGQALIASVSMPTGWYMLGRTPAKTFDLGRDPVFPMSVGDVIRLERIDAARFRELEKEAEAGALIMREGS